MANQNGRSTITGIFLVLFILYGGFAAVKYFSAGFTETQIENDIKEALFLRQGSDFDTEVAENVIIKILEKHEVYYDDEDQGAITVTIDPNTFRVEYHVEYEIDIDYLLFQKVRYVTLDKILGR